MDKLTKNKEINIVAREYGRVNVTVPINATDEETEEAAIQAESEGMASFFKREITVLGNNSIQESIKQFTVGKTVYTLSKAPGGQYCLSGGGESESGNAEELIVNGNVYEAITHCNGYDNLRYVWEKDSTGNLINTDDKKYDNAYQRFLSFVKCYERNGVASENDHDILLISEDEISNFSDLLRDGDYVWIVESVDA